MKKVFFLILIFFVVNIYAQNTIYYTFYPSYTTALEQAAAKGNAIALTCLGSCYDRAAGVSEDRQKAYDCFVQASQKGDVLGKYNLGLYLKKGYVTEPDYKQALLLYNEVISNSPKLTLVYFGMAEIYEKGGYGVQKDLNKAFDAWFQLASLGNSVGEYQVGRYYDEGIAVSEDNDQAIKYFTRAANQGFLYAYDGLASCYIEIGESSKAAEWLIKAYDKGFYVVCHNLGDLYYYGNGVEKSYKKAFEIFSRGAEKTPRCVYRLSVMLRNGLGVDKDLEKAASLLKNAAEKGVNEAQYQYACDKYLGDNTDLDYEVAVKYFLLALEDKYLLAGVKSDICRKLSACYRFGRGVGIDESMADFYMKKAAELGDPDARIIQSWLGLE